MFGLIRKTLLLCEYEAEILSTYLIFERKKLLVLIS